MINKKRLIMMAVAASMVLPTNLTYLSTNTPVLATEVDITGATELTTANISDGKLVFPDNANNHYVVKAGVTLSLTASTTIEKNIHITLEDGAKITTSAKNGFYLSNGTILFDGSGTLESTYQRAGTSDAGGGSILTVSGKCNLTVNNVTLNALPGYWEYGIGVLDGAEGSVISLNDLDIIGKGGLSVNGRISDEPPTQITLTNVHIKGDGTSACSTGIYQAGPAEITLSGNSSIVAEHCGIEIRGGTLTIEDGTSIEATSKLAPQVKQNGGGATTLYAGIAVAPHTTGENVTVNINGGTIKGSAALILSDPQTNPTLPNTSTTPKGTTTLNITGNPTLTSNYEDFSGKELLYTVDFKKAVESLSQEAQLVKFDVENKSENSAFYNLVAEYKKFEEKDITAASEVIVDPKDDLTVTAPEIEIKVTEEGEEETLVKDTDYTVAIAETPAPALGTEGKITISGKGVYATSTPVDKNYTPYGDLSTVVVSNSKGASNYVLDTAPATNDEAATALADIVQVTWGSDTLSDSDYKITVKSLPNGEIAGTFTIDEAETNPKYKYKEGSTPEEYEFTVKNEDPEPEVTYSVSLDSETAKLTDEEAGVDLPKVIVKKGEDTLEENTDYTVAWEAVEDAALDNDVTPTKAMKIGSYKATVTITDGNEELDPVTFTVTADEPEDEQKSLTTAEVVLYVTDKTKKTFTTAEFEDIIPTVTLDGKTVDASEYTLVYTQEGTELSEKPTEAGSYKVKAVANGDSTSYKEATSEVEFTLTATASLKELTADDVIVEYTLTDPEGEVTPDNIASCDVYLKDDAGNKGEKLENANAKVVDVTDGTVNVSVSIPEDETYKASTFTTTAKASSEGVSVKIPAQEGEYELFDKLGISLDFESLDDLAAGKVDDTDTTYTPDYEALTEQLNATIKSEEVKDLGALKTYDYVVKPEDPKASSDNQSVDEATTNDKVELQKTVIKIKLKDESIIKLVIKALTGTETASVVPFSEDALVSGGTVDTDSSGNLIIQAPIREIDGDNDGIITDAEIRTYLKTKGGKNDEDLKEFNIPEYKLNTTLLQSLTDVKDGYFTKTLEKVEAEQPINLADVDASKIVITLAEGPYTLKEGETEVKPAVTSVKIDNQDLPEGSYDVNYANNTKVGTGARVVITLKNSVVINGSKYDGETYTTFDITQPSAPENPGDNQGTGVGGGGTNKKPSKPKPEEPVTPVVGTPTTMYRLYNRLTGEHLFTTDKNERDNLLTSDTWKDEGQGWTAPSVSDTPVYRLLNPNTGDHHYTTDKNEFDTLPSYGWVAEGVAFFSADKDNAENVILHRLYNPNATGAGSHHYTADTNERDTLVAQGWKYEGTAWAGLPAGK